MRSLEKTPFHISALKRAFAKKLLSASMVMLTILIYTSCTTYSSSIVWPTESEPASYHTIPIYKLNKLILIKGEVKGVSGYFIFDTGAPDLILNDQYFNDWRLDPRRTVTGLNGEMHNARISRVSDLKLGDLSFKKKVADVIDLSHIEKKRKVKILGLLGVNLFKGEELEIDLHNRTLRIYKTDKEGLSSQVKRLAADANTIFIPFRYSGALIAMEARINKRSYRIAFDTGSEILMLDKSVMARDSIQTSLLRSQELLSTDGSRTGLEIRQLDKINIGLNLRKVTTAATDFGRLRAYGFNVDGLIGYDLISKGVVTINFKTRMLHINPYDRA